MSFFDAVLNSDREKTHETECPNCKSMFSFKKEDVEVRHNGFDSSLRMQQRAIFILKCTRCNRSFETH